MSEEKNIGSDEEGSSGAGVEARWLGYEATSWAGGLEGGGVTGAAGTTCCRPSAAGVRTSTGVNKCQSTNVLLG